MNKYIMPFVFFCVFGIISCGPSGPSEEEIQQEADSIAQEMMRDIEEEMMEAERDHEMGKEADTIITDTISE